MWDCCCFVGALIYFFLFLFFVFVLFLFFGGWGVVRLFWGGCAVGFFF